MNLITNVLYSLKLTIIEHFKRASSEDDDESKSIWCLCHWYSLRTAVFYLTNPILPYNEFDQISFIFIDKWWRESVDLHTPLLEHCIQLGNSDKEMFVSFEEFRDTYVKIKEDALKVCWIFAFLWHCLGWLNRSSLRSCRCRRPCCSSYSYGYFLWAHCNSRRRCSKLTA